MSRERDLVPPSVVFFGYGPFATAGIDALVASGARLAALVVPGNRTGADVELVRARAVHEGLPVWVQPRRDARAPFVDALRSAAPDAIVVWSYSLRLPGDVLAVPRRGAVNVHTGLLPEYRGGHVLQWALLNGEHETGVTLHYMDEGLDTGPIVAQTRFPIADEDDAVSVKEKLTTAGAALLGEWWPAIAGGTAPRIPQDESRARYWRPRRPEEGAIDWSQPAAEVCRLVRALNANRPGAYVDVGGTRISITKAVPLTDAFRPVRGVRLQADRSHHRMGTHPAKAGSHVPGRARTATNGLRFAAADGDVLVVEASVDGRVLTGAALTGILDRVPHHQSRG